MRTGKKGLRRFAAAICAAALCVSMMPTSGLALEDDTSTGSDAALVQTLEQDETDPSATLNDGKNQKTDSDQTEQGTSTPDDLTAEESKDPEAPAETEEEEPQNPDNQAPAAAPEQNDLDRSAVAMLSNDAGTYANGVSYFTVPVGEERTYYGISGYVINYWEVVSGRGAVTLSDTDKSAVKIRGLQAGNTAILRHWYGISGAYETVYVTVAQDTTSTEPRDVYLFVAKPGDYTLSNVGANYYYLARGGKVADEVTQSTSLVSLDDEEAIKELVAEWPTTPDFLDDVSSPSVGRGSTITIQSDGTVSSFSLYLGDEKTPYTNNDWSISWAKFSYASTDQENGNKYKSHYHVDAVLYKNKTVAEVLNTLQAKKQVADLVLNDGGAEQSENTFTFVIASVDDNGNEQPKVTFSQTIRGEKTEALTGGDQASTVLKPGRYKLYEKQDAGEMRWADTSSQAITFDVYTNGNIHVVTDTTTGENGTFVNTPATYKVTYDLQGGTGSQFDPATGLKYNETYTIPDATPSKENSVFCGWSESPSGEAVYQLGENITIDGDKTLYAVWEAPTVTKSVVLSGELESLNKDNSEIAAAACTPVVSGQSSGYFAYTQTGDAKILYKIVVQGYTGATITVTEQPTLDSQPTSAVYVTAVGANTSNQGQTFTMTGDTATLYYAVPVSGVAEGSSTVVGNTAGWSIGTVSGSAEGEDVTVEHTNNTVRLEKHISKVQRGETELTNVTDDTVLYVGDVVTYEIKITNASKFDIQNLQVNDITTAKGSLPTAVTLEIDGEKQADLTGTWNNGRVSWTIPSLTYDQVQDDGQTATITYTYTVMAADQSPEKTKSLTNTVSVSEATYEVTGTTRTQNFVEVPGLEVIKSGTPQVGDTGVMEVHYTVTVTNKSNADLNQLVLTDEKFEGTPEVSIGDTAVDAGKVQLSGKKLTISQSLAVGATMTVTYDYKVTEPTGKDGSLTVTNTVTADGTTTSGASVTDSATANTQVYAGTVKLALAPIVIYTGGDGNNQAIVGEDGKPVTTDDTGLPIFGVTMTLPDNTQVSVEDINNAVATLYDVTSDTGERANYTWSAIPYNANATVLMQLTPEEGTKAVRIKLTDPSTNETVTADDEFSVADTLYKTYTTELYVQEEDATTIIAKVGNSYYNIDYDESTLTVRGTTEQAETHTVVHEAADLAQNVSVPQAVLPKDAEYKYVRDGENNAGSLVVANDSEVSLLVDEIVEQGIDENQKYVQMMKDKVEEDGGVLGKVPAGSDRTWRFYYMDLVLANNGNAVLTTDSDVTIYWPYPNGVTRQDVENGKYNVKVLHYTKLNRNYTTTFEEELKDCQVEVYSVTPTDQGLCFKVPSSDGFSPFALVYDTVPASTGNDNNNNNNNTTTSTTNVTVNNNTAAASAPAAAAASSAAIPQTGDALPVGLLGGVAAVAAAAFAALFVLRKRKHND